MRYQFALPSWALQVTSALLGIAVLLPVDGVLAQVAPVSPQVRSATGLEQDEVPASAEKDDGKSEEEAEKWKNLMPKEGLGDWQITDFGSQGEVKIMEAELRLEMGEPMTGIHLKDSVEFPRNNFEIELSCNRLDGNDFLCGLTFPVGDEYCSFIGGGWGGSLVGLSSINGMDASENSTSTYFEFDNEKWYKFRVRVDDESIRAWINDKEFIRQDRDGVRFSTRIEVSGSKPLGLCAFRSTVAVKDFRWRPIDPSAEKAAEAAAESKGSPEPSGAIDIK